MTHEYERTLWTSLETDLWLEKLAADMREPYPGLGSLNFFEQQVRFHLLDRSGR